MAEFWEIVLPIIGAGIVGYVIRWFEEKRRRTHEKEAEYRKELKKHLPNLIEPLFKLLGDLWISLIELTNPDRVEYNKDTLITKGCKLTTPVREVKETLVNLNRFVTKNENKLDLLMPHPLQSWQYARVSGFVDSIIGDARKGKIKFDDISKVVNTIMNIQDDLQKIVGFKTKIRLKSEHAFQESLSRFEKLKSKLRR